MDSGYERLAREANGLAKALPFSSLRSVAALVEVCDPADWPNCRRRIIGSLAHAHYRSLTAEFLDVWQDQAAGVSPQSVAAALLTAAVAEKSHEDSQTVELVWTGPDSQSVAFRRTEQAVLEVLSVATRRITLVSYAVYRIPRIQKAIIEAAARGVDIRLIVETPNRLEGQNEYDCLLALGKQVADASTVYYWPQENRPQDENGKLGILHVKCAVSDGRRLFLSSANLTDYAFTINMELGVLVTGGTLPRQVEQHFEQLVDSGVFVRV